MLGHATKSEASRRTPQVSPPCPAPNPMTNKPWLARPTSAQALKRKSEGASPQRFLLTLPLSPLPSFQKAVPGIMLLHLTYNYGVVSCPPTPLQVM